MVCLVQTVHLSWVKISTIFKRIKMSFRLSVIIKEYHRVRPKRLLNLWYVWRKSCTYLESRLTLSPNGPKWTSTWASSPRSTIGCSQNDFRPCGAYDSNKHLSCTDAHSISKMDQNKIPHDSRHLGVPSSASKMILEPIVCSAQTVHQSCVKIGTISKQTKTSFHLRLIS
jgi:hypothetical protein